MLVRNLSVSEMKRQQNDLTNKDEYFEKVFR